MIHDLLLQSLAVMSAGVILWRAEPAINRMSRCTPFLVRWSFILLVVGALALALHALAGHVPDASTVLIAAGVAALLFCERRMRVLTPRSPRAGKNDPLSINRRAGP